MLVAKPLFRGPRPVPVGSDKPVFMGLNPDTMGANWVARHVYVLPMSPEETARLKITLSYWLQPERCDAFANAPPIFVKEAGVEVSILTNPSAMPCRRNLYLVLGQDPGEPPYGAVFDGILWPVMPLFNSGCLWARLNSPLGESHKFAA